MQDDIGKRYLFNLQLFAGEGDTGEKTEKATPRRQEEARKKGQVFKSTDLNSAVILLVGTVTLYVTMTYMINSLEGFTSLYILDRTLTDFNNEYIYAMFIEALMLMGKILFPVFLATFIAALLITYLQVGFIFSAEVLTPKLERIKPC
jgi:flagellar biosynthetic protein FlhB